MNNNDYMPQGVPVQRRRRSERAKEAAQQAQQKPVKQSAAKSVQAASSRAAWEQDNWKQNPGPGHQGYKPAAKVSAGAAKAQQAMPRSGYQAGAWQGMPRQQADYRQQPYAYTDNRQSQQGYVTGYGMQQNAWNGAQGYQQNEKPWGAQMNYPPQEMWQGGQVVPGGDGQPPRKRTVFRNILLLILCIAILAGAAVLIDHVMDEKQLNEYVASFDAVFCNGVYVDGIHLGGMTADQGVAAVQQQAQQRSNAWSVRLTYQGQLVMEIKASDLNMTVDVMNVLNEAWQQGHVGDPKTRKAAMDALQTTPYEGYTAMPSGDNSVIDTILTNLRNQVYRAPQDAQLVSFDPEKTANPFNFQQEVPGRYLNTEPVKEQLYQMVSTMQSGSIELNPETIQPTVTVADLQKTVKLRASAYTKISTTSTEDRNNNIIRSCQLISGTIIRPGETFSFNNVVGKRTTDNGFFPAIEYANGEHVEGIGGGVCQTSSTVYLASVYAGMDIVKREPHSDAVNYTEYGKDATVYWEYGRKIDFVFRNNTSSNIYMVARVQSDPSNKRRLICKVEIYGEDMGNVTYGLETKTVEVLKPGNDEIVKDKKAQYVTYTDEQYVQRQPADGYVVESYRVKYVDGKAVDHQKLYTDTYAAKAKRIYVGVTNRPVQ